jgi:hypothetical protein
MIRKCLARSLTSLFSAGAGVMLIEVPLVLVLMLIKYHCCCAHSGAGLVSGIGFGADTAVAAGC